MLRRRVLPDDRVHRLFERGHGLGALEKVHCRVVERRDSVVHGVLFVLLLLQLLDFFHGLAARLDEPRCEHEAIGRDGGRRLAQVDGARGFVARVLRSFFHRDQ